MEKPSGTNMKRTPLNAIHREWGGRMIEFGGWEMPVQYTSILEEHLAVRSGVGVFDISHMGEFEVSGAEAARFLNSVLTNDIAKLRPGWGQYSLLCHDQGGVIDDLYVFQLGRDQFLLIVNASRIDIDYAWLQKAAAAWAGQALDLRNASDQWAALAVQGPKTARFIDAVARPQGQGTAQVRSVSELKKNQIVPCEIGVVTGMISRTGYTGEDGFEVLAPSAQIELVWRALFESGKNCGVRPAGLGARDTLRLEACYPLYGHELDEQTTPLEAGLHRFVGLHKNGFTGQGALHHQAAQGVNRQLVAFRLMDKAPPPRAGYVICDGGDAKRPIGQVTSGTLCPSLGVGAGLGYVLSSFAKVGTQLAIDIRGRAVEATVVHKPLYPPRS
jgi:aminomethyltransferase